MKLLEFEGKKLFRKYKIPVSKGQVINKRGGKIKLSSSVATSIATPVVIKAQVYSGDRKRVGGIVFVNNKKQIKSAIDKLFAKKINDEEVGKILVEKKASVDKEYYVSFSYDTNSRSPVLAVSKNGGSGIKKAKIFPVDVVIGVEPYFIRNALYNAGFANEDVRGLSSIIYKLWNLFVGEYATTAEINPIFKTKAGEFIAGDSKIILDDEKIQPGVRRFVDMDGDIAIIASGGGASMLNMDTLLKYGGRPSNYTEYSGNPPAEVVEELTKKVLKRKGLKGLWVVGGIANFTDVYETMRGFADGLRSISPKPTYPIVIRRDGPRQREAFKLLEKLKDEGYDIHLFDGRTRMSDSAKKIIELAYGK